MSEEVKNDKVSVSEILDISYKVWKENFTSIALAITIVYIPVQILIELASIAFEYLRGPNYLSSYSEWHRLVNETRIYNFIRGLIGIIATLGIYSQVSNIFRNDEDERGGYELVKFGLKKWPENFGHTFLAGLIVLAYSIMLIIPGIYKAVQFSFVSNQVCDGEDDPLEESKALVEGRWFEVFGMSFLIYFTALIIESIVLIPFLLLPEGPMFTITLGVIATIASSFAIVIKGVYYCDLKKKNMRANEDVILCEEK
ncbi:hypothetical protein EYV94_18380 [Puteibacter caeruleilacunae]|nr:hypothetical protein EYV94_18380 [Puteibacter caeruleilacunae]